MTFYELYQYYKNKGAETGEGIESISNKQVIVPQQYQQGGGDGPQGDFGKFGNLLQDTEKTFMKDVWTETGGVGAYDFVPTEVKGYKNATSGIYQTVDGKNINHAGLNVKPAFAYVMDALGLGDQFDPNETGGRKPGSIKGTFTEGIPQNWKDTISNIGNPFKNFNNPFKNKSTIDYSTIADTSVDANENSYVDTSNNNGNGGGSGGVTINSSGNYVNTFSGGDPGNAQGITGNEKSSNKGSSSTAKGGQGTASYGQSFHDYAKGGRVNFELGGDTNYRAMVTRMFIESGAEDGTGMGIEEFANTYFPLPQMASGGIINSCGY